MTTSPPLWVQGLLCAIVSFALALAWRALARRRGWVDLPDGRRLHREPTPRGGGIGIVVLLLTVAWPASMPEYRLLWLGLAAVVAGGLWDDLRPLPPLPKALFQALGALAPALAFPLFPAAVGPVAAVALAWFLVIALVNIWNFMDGSNGLAASQGALLAAAILALALLGTPGWGGVAAPALVLAAGCSGFLPMNLPQARVFLGDVGSQAIGFALAVMMLQLCRDAGATAGAVLWLLPSAFLLDAGLTLLGRLRRAEKVWQGHRLHLYQRAVSAGWSHVGICLAYAAWTTAACALAIWMQVTGSNRVHMIVGSVYVIGMLIYLSLGRRWPRPDKEGSRE